MQNIAGIELSDQELAALLATRESENAQTFRQLVDHSNAGQLNIAAGLLALVDSQILKPVEMFDEQFGFCYVDSPTSQAVYEAVHNVGPITI